MSTKIEMLVRSNQTEQQEYHCSMVDHIPGDEVCVLYIGGNGTIDTSESVATRKANGDAKRIRSEIIKPFFYDKNGVDIPVYAVAYDFDGYDAGVRDLSRDISRGNIDGIAKKQYLVFEPKSIKRLFRDYVMDCISENNEKISLDEVKYRLGKYDIYFSDQNSGAFYKYMDEKLRDLQYTDDEISEVFQFVQNKLKQEHMEHIDKLFNMVILPRISENEERLLITDALRRMRKITFVVHCYGAFVAKKLQEMAKSEMRKLGYSSAETNAVLNQMLIVAHAPSVRLYGQTNGFISFMSGFDEGAVTPKNWLRSYIKKNVKQDRQLMDQEKLNSMEHTWIPLVSDDFPAHVAFLSKNMGNMFIIPRGFDYSPSGFEYQIGEVNPSEHTNTSYVRAGAEQNVDGCVLNRLARNVIINGIKNSLKQHTKFTPLPDVSQLINKPKSTVVEREKTAAAFAIMRKNGNKLAQNAYEYAREVIGNWHARISGQKDKSPER